MERGKFISFEGSEGCGKSTQIARLAERLKSRGREVLLTREPGGTAVGEKVRDLLQHAPEGEALAAESELLLFAASRAQLVREVIEPALARGCWVVADRFLDSTTVYQGAGRGLDAAAVGAINAFAVGDLLPDLTILLDMDAEKGRSRAVAAAGGKPDRIEGLPLAFFEKVRAGYLALAEKEERFAVLDASRSVEEVAAGIESVCQERFGNCG